MDKNSKKTNKREKGKTYENMAISYLEKLGYTILHKNFHTRYGEIDIIAEEGNNLVFIEVKGRTSTKFGYPEESINISKINKLITTAEIYLSKYVNKDYEEIRFDVITILNKNIKNIKNAIEIEN